MITTATGLVAIENIQPGDMVLAFNEETGEYAYKEVVRLFVNTTDEITHVTINNEDGEQEKIDSTPEHPFYVEGKGWVEASALHAGMTIWFANGTKGTVEDISNEGLEEPVTVYNFEVKDFHTYFVGESGVLVHNTCDGNVTRTQNGQENDTSVGNSSGQVPASLLQGDANTSVYLGIKDGNADYVGISKDVATRQSQHGDRFDYLSEITSEQLTRRQARAIEQAMIVNNPQFSNKINSISPNRDWYDEAVQWGTSWLTERGYITP